MERRGGLRFVYTCCLYSLKPVACCRCYHSPSRPSHLLRYYWEQLQRRNGFPFPLVDSFTQLAPILHLPIHHIPVWVTVELVLTYRAPNAALYAPVRTLCLLGDLQHPKVGLEPLFASCSSDQDRPELTRAVSAGRISCNDAGGGPPDQLRFGPPLPTRQERPASRNRTCKI